MLVPTINPSIPNGLTKAAYLTVIQIIKSPQVHIRVLIAELNPRWHFVIRQGK